jgi:hypothetical protein
MVPLARLLLFIFTAAVFYWSALVAAQSQPTPAPGSTKPIFGRVFVVGYDAACYPASVCTPAKKYNKTTTNKDDEIKVAFSNKDTAPGLVAGHPDYSGQVILGSAFSGQGLLRVGAEVTRPDEKHGPATFTAQAMRVDHFSTLLGQPDFVDPGEGTGTLLTILLQANVEGAAKDKVQGSFNVGVWQSKQYQKRGHWTADWWRSRTGPCLVPYPNNCFDGDNPDIQIDISSNLDGSTFWELRIGNQDPQYFTLGPDSYGKFIEKRLNIATGWDWAIISNITARAVLDSVSPGGPTHVVCGLDKIRKDLC